ncbi:hypothetical protein [Rhodoferax sp.]|uniref:hypothetical protein n=1 Tax=Rhodoferax sp. TaxID=50421 RepID=UPI0025FCBBB3|nr:hypothetical protein [Rhodoferax sp.]
MFLSEWWINGGWLWRRLSATCRACTQGPIPFDLPFLKRKSVNAVQDRADKKKPRNAGLFADGNRPLITAFALA